MTAAPEPRWLDAGEQAAWRAFLTLQTRLAARLNRDLMEKSGISMPDFSVLATLSEHPDGQVRVLELARSLQWEKSRLSHQLSRMQLRGLVTRANCDEDRRGAWIELTGQGRAVIEAAAPMHVDAVRRYLFDRLDAEQQAALAGICAAVVDALADDAEPCEAADSCEQEVACDALTGISGPLVPAKIL